MKTDGPKKGDKPAPANVSWESRKLRGMIEEGARTAREVTPSIERILSLDPSPASETRPKWMSEESAKKIGLLQIKEMVLSLSKDSRAIIENRLGKTVEDASPQELKNVLKELEAGRRARLNPKE